MLRILLIISVVLVLVVFSFTFVRFVGLSRPINPINRGFFTHNFTIVAHRGGSLEAPENTLKAFKNAATISNEIIMELDVHLSRDGALMVMHDPTVDRTTNGKGEIKMLTLDELKKLDAGDGEQIPTLDEVLSALPDSKLIVELKPNNLEIVDKLVEIVKKHRAEARVMIGSSHHRLLEKIRKEQPSWNTTASRDDILRGIMLVSAYLEPIGPWKGDHYLIPETHDSITVLTDRFLKEVHRRNKKLLVWTVNDEKDMLRLRSFGIDGWITDRPSVAYRLKNQ